MHRSLKNTDTTTTINSVSIYRTKSRLRAQAWGKANNSRPSTAAAPSGPPRSRHDRHPCMATQRKKGEASSQIERPRATVPPAKLASEGPGQVRNSHPHLPGPFPHPRASAPWYRGNGWATPAGHKGRRTGKDRQASRDAWRSSSHPRHTRVCLGWRSAAPPS